MIPLFFITFVSVVFDEFDSTEFGMTPKMWDDPPNLNLGGQADPPQNFRYFVPGLRTLKRSLLDAGQGRPLLLENWYHWYTAGLNIRGRHGAMTPHFSC